jgi:hypothetical protein
VLAFCALHFLCGRASPEGRWTGRGDPLRQLLAT